MAQVKLARKLSEIDLSKDETLNFSSSGSRTAKRKGASQSMLLKAVHSKISQTSEDAAFRRRAQSVVKKGKAVENTNIAKQRDSSMIMKKAAVYAEIDAVDNYFMQHADSASSNCRTSRRTLSKLRTGSSTGLPDPEYFESLLAKYKPLSIGITKKRQDDIAAVLFPRWPMFLKEGFNILLYGVGSKREILTRFQREHLNGENCVLVSGFQPNVGIRQILNIIVSDVLQLTDAPAAAHKQLETISDFFSRPAAVEEPLYLLLNSIDGRNLRTVKAQAILARLADIPHIHIIASMDHMNLPLLWSQTELSRFSWLWEDFSSLAPYTAEAGFSNSRLLQQLLTGRSQAVDSHLFTSADVDVVALTRLRHVMTSLTQNARDIFRLLVEYHLQAMADAFAARKTAPVKVNKKGAKHSKLRVKNENDGDEPSIHGMPLDELYWRSRDAFLVNSEVTLRAQLTEFKDHKLVKFTKSHDGTELLKIPLDRASLREILENKEAFG